MNHLYKEWRGRNWRMPIKELTMTSLIWVISQKISFFKPISTCQMIFSKHSLFHISWIYCVLFESTVYTGRITTKWVRYSCIIYLLNLLTLLSFSTKFSNLLGFFILILLHFKGKTSSELVEIFVGFWYWWCVGIIENIFGHL